MKKTLLLIAVFFTAILSSNAQEAGQQFQDGDFWYTITNDTEGSYEVKVDSITHTASAVNMVIPASAKMIIIPGMVEPEMSVTGIGDLAFRENAEIVTVELPSSITTINQKAFEKCANLTTINLENIVTFAGNSQFATCQKLTDVDLSSAETLPGYQFYWCLALKKVNNFNSAVTIGNGVFRRSGITELNIPATVTSIANQLFRQCENLTQFQVNWASHDVYTIDEANIFGNITAANVKMYVPVGTESIYEGADSPWAFNAGDEVLLPAENIIEGDMPESSVGNVITVNNVNYTVSSDDPLEALVSGVAAPTAALTIDATVTDPATSLTYAVTAIGQNSFLDDTALTSVVLPESVTSLKANAFSGCTNLETINLENIVSFDGQNTFYNTPKLAVANLASATVLVGNFAFHGLGDSSLTSVSIPSAVTLGRALFSTAQFSSINIPATVTSISTKTFWNCTALTSVEVNWTTAETIPVIDITDVNATFLGVDVSSVSLHVPTGTTDLYNAVDGWKDFNITEETLSIDGVDGASFSVYPNPVQDVVTISSQVSEDLEISIYDITGGLLSSTSSREATTNIDVSNLVSGVYILKVKVGSSVHVQKIVKK